MGQLVVEGKSIPTDTRFATCHSRVKHLREVGGCNNDHIFGLRKAVHLHKQLQVGRSHTHSFQNEDEATSRSLPSPSLLRFGPKPG